MQYILRLIKTHFDIHNFKSIPLQDGICLSHCLLAWHSMALLWLNSYPSLHEKDTFSL